MSKVSDAAASKATSGGIIRVSLIPFTGGLICFVYAFFWPESYGAWLGNIVHAFRVAAGF